MGHAWSGHVIFKRISTDISIPSTTEKSASRRYWMPITLWSMLKMYLRMKPVGAWCAPCPAACPSRGWPSLGNSASAISAFLPPGRHRARLRGSVVERVLLDQIAHALVELRLRHRDQLVVLVRGEDEHVAAHLVVLLPAQLGAGDLVLPGLLRREVHT